MEGIPSIAIASTQCEEQAKWTGGVRAVLHCDLEAAWSLKSDFVGLTKWVPTITACRLLEGEPNACGCLRFCQGSGTTWVHERLLEIDNAAHSMTYRMEDNHFVFPHGFQGYVAKVQLGEAGEGQTWLTWIYEVDPVLAATREEVTDFMTKFYNQSVELLEQEANKLVAQTHGTASPVASSRTDLRDGLSAQTTPLQASA